MYAFLLSSLLLPPTPREKKNNPPTKLPGRVHGRGRAPKQARAAQRAKNFKRLRVAMAAVTPGISMATGWNRAGALGRSCWGAGPSSLLANCGATRRAFASGAAAMAALKVSAKKKKNSVQKDVANRAICTLCVCVGGGGLA